MVTLKGYTANLIGKSTDSKPTDVEVNTIFHELDTDKKYYFDGTTWTEIPNTGGGGGGFTPTTEQLAAMNSGITAEDVTQIGTNETNISLLQEDVAENENNISSEQAKTTGMSEGGSNYITVGGIRVYVSATAPTGARTGDLWIGG